MKAETFKDRIAIVGNNLKSAREENAKLVHENLELKSQLKEVEGKILSILHDIDDPSIKIERIRNSLEYQNKEDERL